jgi:hypothetical protein
MNFKSMDLKSDMQQTEMTQDSTYLGSSVLNLKSLTQKQKQGGYHAQSWFGRVKS